MILQSLDSIALPKRTLSDYVRFLKESLTDAYPYLVAVGTPGVPDTFDDFYKRIHAQDQLWIQKKSDIIANLVTQHDVKEGRHEETPLAALFLATTYLSRSEKYATLGEERSAWLCIADAMFCNGLTITKIFVEYNEAGAVARKTNAVKAAKSKANTRKAYHELALKVFEEEKPLHGWQSQSQAAKVIAPYIESLAKEGKGPRLPEDESLEKSIKRWIAKHPRFNEMFIASDKEVAIDQSDT